MVIRRKLPKLFPLAARRRVADVLQWRVDSVTRTLVGTGWAWLSGQQDVARAAVLAERLRNEGLIAGLLSPDDWSDADAFFAVSKIVAEDVGFTLLGTGGEAIQVSQKSPGGLALLGLRWDGTELRPYLRSTQQPALVAWGAHGPLTLLPLREGAVQAGFTPAELAVFVRQALAMQAVTLLDDSYQPDDLPSVSTTAIAYWTRAGGDSKDARMLAHAVLVRAFHRRGWLSTSPSAALDLNAPLPTYDILSRRWYYPDLVQASSLASGVAGLWLLRTGFSELAITFGMLAGVLALVQGLRSLYKLLRLRARPRSRIRTMAVGPVYLEGTIECAMLLVSPMRGLRCVHYIMKEERRSGHKWRVVRTVRSPEVPFYLVDDTGRVLVDAVGAEWHGMELYTHAVSATERIREWVIAESVHASVYGVMECDPEAAVVRALREGLQAACLTRSTERFDVNRDGVLDAAERKFAMLALEATLATAEDNVTLSKQEYVRGRRDEPLVVATVKGLPFHWVAMVSILGWMVVGVFFLAAFHRYPEHTRSFIEGLLRGMVQ